MKNYYSETKLAISFEKPTLRHKYDVIIIGGGLAGVTTAYELAKGGKHVAILEAKTIGYGASGRNGGFVTPGFSEGLPNIEKKVGKETAHRLYNYSKEGADYILDFLESQPLSELKPRYGRLRVCRKPKTADFFENFKKRNEVYGEDWQILDKASTQNIVKSERYHGSAYSPSGFHIHPLNYTLSLAKAAENIGVDIYENTSALCFEKQLHGFHITTKRQTFQAEQIIVTGSAYMKHFYPKIERAILPVATYIVVSEPMSDELDTAISCEYAISDTRRAGDYYRRLPDGRLLWGGRITTSTQIPPALIEKMKKDILSVYPQLKNICLSHSWIGLMGYAIHKMPIISEVEKGLWVNSAFGGHGLNTTTMGGLLISRAILNEDDGYKLFSAYTAQYGGGIFGRIATQAAYWQMQFQDYWEER